VSRDEVSWNRKFFDGLTNVTA